jgi:hypothetical protein
MPPPYAIRVKTETGWQDIAIQGATGEPGAIEVFEQPDTPPADAVLGAIWIDTDAPTPVPGVGPTGPQGPQGPQGDPGVAGVGPPIFVSSLPSSPVDGMEIYYQSASMATDGIVWHLRYRAAASGSYKWEHVSGSPLWAEVQAAVTISNTAYAEISGGPAITLPLAGDYMLRFGCNIESVGTTGWRSRMSVTALDTDSCFMAGPGNAAGNSHGGSIARSIRKTFTATRQAAQHRGDNAVASIISFRFIEFTPIRVG